MDAFLQTKSLLSPEEENNMKETWIIAVFWACFWFSVFLVILGVAIAVFS